MNVGVTVLLGPKGMPSRSAMSGNGGNRVGIARRSTGTSALLLLATVATVLLMTGSSAASPTPARTWSPPLHGSFHHVDHVAAHGCVATLANTTAVVPTSNLTTGVSHMGVQTSANASACSGRPAHGEASSALRFMTHQFGIRTGFHHVVITWSLRWYAQVIASGGRVNASWPASASYIIGLDGSGVCFGTVSAPTCAVFPNSSAPGSNHSVGWFNSTTVTNATYGHLGTATVSVYLNATFGGTTRYWIYTTIFTQVDAKSRGSATHAHAIVLLSPILGGYAKLVSITIT